MSELRNPFRGRPTPPPVVVTVRDITRADLPRLEGPRHPQPATNPKKIKEAHHTVAKLLSIGHDYQRVADLTGYSYSRIQVLANSPAMAELVAQYRMTVDESFLEAVDVYNDLLVTNKLRAERMIEKRLEEAEESDDSLPIRSLLAISRDAADRTGHPKGRVNINTNADFASVLEQRIARAKNITPSADKASGPAPAPIRRIA